MSELRNQKVWDNYERDGVITPIRIFDEETAAGFHDIYRDFQKHSLEARGRETFVKPHLVSLWAHEIAHHPAILDEVEKILGPDILLWCSDFFTKPAGAGKKVGWHQDSKYWGLRPTTKALSVWLSITPSNISTGCMRVVPRTHKYGILEHQDTYADDNMLSRGQEVVWDFTEQDVLDIELEPGQVSIHHLDLIHGGLPNPSDQDRIGFVMRYITPDTQQTLAEDSAVLVRGEDRYNNYLMEPAPTADFTPEGIRELDLAMKRPSGFDDQVLK